MRLSSLIFIARTNKPSLVVASQNESLSDQRPDTMGKRTSERTSCRVCKKKVCTSTCKKTEEAMIARKIMTEEFMNCLTTKDGKIWLKEDVPTDNNPNPDRVESLLKSLKMFAEKKPNYQITTDGSSFGLGLLQIHSGQALLLLAWALDILPPNVKQKIVTESDLELIVNDEVEDQIMNGPVGERLFSNNEDEEDEEEE